jgi:hypothetical protein
MPFFKKKEQSDLIIDNLKNNNFVCDNCNLQASKIEYVIMALPNIFSKEISENTIQLTFFCFRFMFVSY